VSRWRSRSYDWNPGLMNADSSARPAIQDGFEVECRGGPPPGQPTYQSSTIHKFCRVPDPPRYMTRMLQACADVYSEYRSGDRA
jgi:hypothetical protein